MEPWGPARNSRRAGAASLKAGEGVGAGRGGPRAASPRPISGGGGRGRAARAAGLQLGGRIKRTWWQDFKIPLHFPGMRKIKREMSYTKKEEYVQTGAIFKEWSH